MSIVSKTPPVYYKYDDYGLLPSFSYSFSNDINIQPTVIIQTNLELRNDSTSSNSYFYIDGLQIQTFIARGIWTNQNLIVKNSNINFNNAGSTYAGGGVCGLKNVYIENSIIKDNTAGTGGGIYSEGKLFAINSKILNNSAAFENLTLSNGGGIYSKNNAYILQSYISNNEAFNNGGGIYGYGNTYIINSESYNNKGLGGGIYGKYSVVANSTFSDKIFDIYSTNELKAFNSCYSKGYSSPVIFEKDIKVSCDSSKLNSGSTNFLTLITDTNLKTFIEDKLKKDFYGNDRTDIIDIGLIELDKNNTLIFPKNHTLEYAKTTEDSINVKLNLEFNEEDISKIQFIQTLWQYLSQKISLSSLLRRMNSPKIGNFRKNLLN